jgi:hypothetical protein
MPHRGQPRPSFERAVRGAIAKLNWSDTMEPKVRRFARGIHQSTALDNGRLGRLTLCQLSYSRAPRPSYPGMAAASLPATSESRAS